MFLWSFPLRQLRVVSGYRRNMGYLRVDCRAIVFAHLVTIPCPYPVGDLYSRHENHLSVDCPGVGQIACGSRTGLPPDYWRTLRFWRADTPGGPSSTTGVLAREVRQARWSIQHDRNTCKRGALYRSSESGYFHISDQSGT